MHLILCILGFGVAERLKAFKVKNIVYSGNKAKIEGLLSVLFFCNLKCCINTSQYVI